MRLRCTQAHAHIISYMGGYLIGTSSLQVATMFQALWQTIFDYSLVLVFA